MKTRNGFVSNSSSTSFTIYGISFNNNEDTLKEAMLPEIVEIIDAMPAPNKWSDDFSDKLEQYLDNNKFKLSVQTGQDSEYIYFGESWPDEDETPRQFKVRIKETLEKIFKPGCGALGHHEESWYDG